MITSQKDEWLMRTNIRTKLGIVVILTLLIIGLCLLTVATQAQSRFSYGLEAGAGTMRMDTRYLVCSREGITFQIPHASERRLSGQIGGYARFYPLRWLFVQSGLYYTYNENSLSLTLETRQLTDLGSADDYEDYEVAIDRSPINYRLHQLEAPLVLGVRFARLLRVYTGSSWGFSLNTSTETATIANYQYNNDPIFRNMRVGIGADVQRFSVDIFYQRTVSNQSWFRANHIVKYPYADRISETKLEYDDFYFRKVMVTVGYRLY